MTRDIDMYLIGPFPRPQFSRGPWPQLLPLRGPSSRLRCAISPLEPVLGHPPNAAQSQRVERHATTPGSRSGTTRAPPSTPGSTRRRAARHREAERPVWGSRRAPNRPPSNDPPDHEPSATDRLDGREEPEPTHRVPMTHRAVRPSKTPPRRRAGFTPEEHPTPARRAPDGRPAKLPTDIGRRENSTSRAIEEPSQRPGSGPRRRRRRRA